jgi:hypothetical protein
MSRLPGNPLLVLSRTSSKPSSNRPKDHHRPLLRLLPSLRTISPHPLHRLPLLRRPWHSMLRPLPLLLLHLLFLL